jgi:hypothetical protein
MPPQWGSFLGMPKNMLDFNPLEDTDLGRLKYWTDTDPSLTFKNQVFLLLQRYIAPAHPQPSEVQGIRIQSATLQQMKEFFHNSHVRFYIVNIEQLLLSPCCSLCTQGGGAQQNHRPLGELHRFPSHRQPARGSNRPVPKGHRRSLRVLTSGVAQKQRLQHRAPACMHVRRVTCAYVRAHLCARRTDFIGCIAAAAA